MKINIMSDLHLEFSKGDMEGLPGGDVLLLAGDIGLAADFGTYIPFLERASNLYETVLMIMGNHEHYHGDFNKSADQIQQAIDSHELHNVHFLNDDTYELADDLVVIGSTLWSDIDRKYEWDIGRSMNDFRIVKNFDTKIARAMHYKHLDYIVGMMKHHSKKKIIVMTHHAPTMRCIAEFKGSALNSAYGTDLTDIIETYMPDVWIHGHMHNSWEYDVGETTIICNPRGYYGYMLNKEFDINLGVEF